MTLHPILFYLPLTEAAADAFMLEAQLPTQPIEWAGLWLLLAVLRHGGLSRAESSRYLAELYPLFMAESAATAAQRLATARAELGESWLLAKPQLAEAGFAFAPESVLEAQLWRGGDGGYDDRFQLACRAQPLHHAIGLTAEPLAADDAAASALGSARLELARPHMYGTDDQARAIRALMATPDEHFAMSAYAGTGKTHVILALAAAGGRYTHLAPTVAHRQALLQRIGSQASIQSLTLYDLAVTMADSVTKRYPERWSRPPRVGPSQWSIAQQAEFIGLPGLAGMNAGQSLLSLLRVIRYWCFSQDSSLGLEHVRRVFGGQSGLDLSPYLEWAKVVWRAMLVAPASGQPRVFGLHLYHLVKWLDEVGAELPALGTLLLDEAHDLPAPWHALLQRYPAGWVTMGDPYQCLSGAMPRLAQAKSLVMAQSVRSGQQATPIFQQLLDLHSEVLVHDVLRGAPDHLTRPHRYPPGASLPEQGLRVYGQIWAMLEDALWLNSRQAAFQLIQASQQVLVQSVKDAISLRRYGEPPKRYELREFRSWALLAQYLDGQGYRRVLRLFERGFDETHLQQLLASQTVSPTSGLTLGLLEHCKNMEFEIVTLADCCIGIDPVGGARFARDERIKAIYVAMTRARGELWYPAETMARLASATVSAG